MRKRIYHMIKMASAAILAGALAVSCSDKGEEPGGADSPAGSIRVNTRAVAGSRNRLTSGEIDSTFTVLFWQVNTHLEPPTADTPWPETWPVPYLAAHAPQHVDFYNIAVFDTHYPYPEGDATLYATGFAPGNVLEQDNLQGYRRLTLNASNLDKGRYDVLGCDAWADVYKGSQTDPFSQPKNKLYFRHLAAKLLFFADRDRNTTERKQYVRNVRITNLRMSIDGVEDEDYTSMYTPDVFEWKMLDASYDFTAPYTAALEKAKAVSGNQGVASLPRAGYKAVEAEAFAGDNNANFVLERHNADRVPVAGMFIDSCYVCNPMGDNGAVITGQKIRLKMDIRAEVSFNPNFPMPDAEKPGQEGSNTDDMTFIRTWEDVPLDAIYKVDADGNPTAEPVNEFKPGMEYRVYIHFYRSGVNLVALEQPWNVGGVHYITISGSDPKPQN